MNTEMMQGYFDGRNPDNPEPSANRTRSYRHGFQSGRDDLARRPSAPYHQRIREAHEADTLDSMDGATIWGITHHGQPDGRRPAFQPLKPHFVAMNCKKICTKC